MIDDFQIEVPEPRPTSAQLKLARAGVLLGDLVREVEAFEQSEAFVIRFAGDVLDDVTRIDCFLVQTAEPDPIWALRASEVLHNLRTSLDHAVWARTAEWSTRPDLARFPICDTAEEFDGQRGDLEGVDEHAQAIIERMQPFNIADGPDLDGMTILRNLTDWDAYEMFEVDAESQDDAVVFYSQTTLLTALPSWETPSGEIYRLLDRRDAGESEELPPEVDCSLDYEMCILGVPIVGIFEAIWWQVADIVREIENQLPLPGQGGAHC